MTKCLAAAARCEARGRRREDTGRLPCRRRHLAPRRSGKPRGRTRRQARCCRKGMLAPGSKFVHFGEFPDNRMDTVALLDVVRPVEYLIERYRPGTVLTHHAGDLNVDHRIVHRAVATACRPQAGHPVRTLLTFEVPSSTEWQPPGSAPAFVPDWFVDISGALAQKLAALEEYASELRAWPHPRSPRAVEHLARWRGATIGAGAAEAFVLGRHLS